MRAGVHTRRLRHRQAHHPHGASVAVTATAVLEFTGASNPECHLAAAEAFGVDISSVKQESAEEFLVALGNRRLGSKEEDVEELAEGMLPQRSVDVGARVEGGGGRGEGAVEGII